MSGKLVKDLPTLGGGVLSNSSVVLTSNDGNTLSKSSISDIRTTIIDYPLSYIVEQNFDMSNGNFYRVWNNGVIEQGGVVGYTASSTPITFSLLKPYTTDTSYIILGSSATLAAAWTAEANFRLIRVSKTSFSIQDGGNNPKASAFWYAIGK